MKMAKTKERIRAKAEANAKAKLEQQITSLQQIPQIPAKPVVSDEELIKIFSSGEKVERTMRSSNNKKKGKK